MFRILSGILLGWGLGANDSANVFGTAVSSRMIRYSTAVILAAIFVILGAFLQGGEGMHTLSSLSEQDMNSAFVTSTAAAITVIIMTVLKLPISTSQAVVGAIIGGGVLAHKPIDTAALMKIVICWIATPLGGFFFAFIFYALFRRFFKLINADMVSTDGILRTGLILAGCYGAYALGANNVANVTGVYVGDGPDALLTVNQAVLIGGISIAIGVVTYSKNVMLTVGKGIVPLDAFSALVTVVAHAVTVHIFAIVGVPVSTSQAIVGAVMGIGVIRNIEAINYHVVGKIFSGWLLTPVTAFVVALLLNLILHLELNL
jgi:PiT family inorganic phosphate transporter